MMTRVPSTLCSAILSRRRIVQSSIEFGGTIAQRRFVVLTFKSSKVRSIGASESGLDVSDDDRNGNHNNDDDDAHHRKTYRLTGTGVGTRVDVITTDTGHTLATDIPKSMGGKDTAPQPVETLLAAWMGCTQATALFVGRHLPTGRVMIERLEFQDIVATRDERGAIGLPLDKDESIPSRLQRMTGIVRVFARRDASLTPDQLKMLREQTERRCPVANMIVASGCVMDVEWVDGNGVNASYETGQS